MAEGALSLLPGNASPFLRAESETSGARRPLPAALIKSVWNPQTCPVDLLPYLAAGLGLELWDDAWPDAKKRAAVADLWRLKRNKTKLKGIKGYLELVGAALVAAHTPRQRLWLVRSLGDADRAAQMAAMPQIRIFPTVAAVPASPAKLFLSGHIRKQFLRPGGCLVPSDALARWAARAVYLDRGVSTPIFVRGLDDPLDATVTVELTAPASVAKLFLSGRGPRQFLSGKALLPSDAADRVLAITPDVTATSFAVPQGLVPTTVRPVRTADVVPARPGQIFLRRTPLGRGALRWSDAASHVYDQLVLFDPTRLAGTRTPYSFLGWSRWGRKPYTAEIRVDVPLTRPPLQAGFGKPLRGLFLRRSDMSPLWKAVAAVNVAKAKRDTVWINTQLFAPIQFSAGLRFGDAAFETFGSARKLN